MSDEGAGGEGTSSTSISDSGEAGSVSRAELTIVKHGMCNEIAQVQLALQKSINDLAGDGRRKCPLAFDAPLQPEQKSCEIS